MSLEQEINQKKFRSEFQKLAINMVFTAKWLEAIMDNFFKEANLTPQQYNVLRILRGSQEPLSTCVIRERMLDKMSDASRIVDRLKVKGLVTKKTDGNDKRLVAIEISKKGLKLLETLDPQINELEDKFSGLSKEDAVSINLLLDKMRSKTN